MKRLFTLLLLALTACGDADSVTMRPDPVALTEDALGHFCQMHVLNHPGPKAQVHLAGMAAPIWFAQVRDGIAFIKSNDRPAEVLAIYVNDMGKAENWNTPGSSNWIDASEAYFVVESDARGGMGAPEMVPFESLGDAEAFALNRGGRVMQLSTIPVQLVLSPIEHPGSRGPQS